MSEKLIVGKLVRREGKFLYWAYFESVGQLNSQLYLFGQEKFSLIECYYIKLINTIINTKEANNIHFLLFYCYSDPIKAPLLPITALNHLIKSMIKPNLTTSPSIAKSPKAFEMFMTDHEFYIRTTDKEFDYFSGIKINRLTSKISTITLTQFQQQTSHINSKHKELIDLVMGTVIINSEAYLLIVNQIQCSAILQQDRIHQIKNVKFIPFKHKFLYNSIDQTQNEKILHFMREQLLKDNFYFCYNQDLTLTRTKHFDKVQTDKKYWWNQKMLEMFKLYQLTDCWYSKVIQGHVRQIYCENQYFSYYYCMISRRSKQMAGTRFNHRGLNQNHQVSNFVQTEQIFICHNFLFSHVSLRGSVPLFWKQESVKADIVLKHKLQTQHQAAIQRHYHLLEEQYKGKICTINLLSKSKMPEKDLKSRFEYYFFRALKEKQESCLYLYFDLNQEMKDEDGQKSIDLFLNSSKDIFAGEQNFFICDRYTRQVLGVQKIYPRINCLDCIDRTNVIMARISQHFLEQFNTKDKRVKLKEKNLYLPVEFRKNLISLWVELGNCISMLYCGTQSVANHMTKKQKNSIFSFLSGGIKSINRYYNANVNDNFKHQCIQFLLGRKNKSSQTQYFTDNITRKILDQMKYCTFDQVKMYLVTWNCSMVDPLILHHKEKQKIFTFLDHDIDIVVFNLQEIVELNSYNVLLGNNQNILSDWSKAILECLNNPQINRHLKYADKTFQLCANHDLVGIASFFFCTKEVSERIQNFQWHDIKTGFKGNSGHKGGIMLFLQIDSTWITFINCHLASGEGKKSQRFQDIQFMHNEAIKDRRLRRLFDLSEFKFFAGDMNFSLQGRNQYVRQQLTKLQVNDREKRLTGEELQQLLAPLLEKDEKTLTHHGNIASYEEAEITFMPTYKFDLRQKKYDQKKTPSWYDRILYQATDQKKICVLRYNDIDVYLSDHKPVYAMFNILVRKQDSERKEKFISTYLTG